MWSWTFRPDEVTTNAGVLRAMRQVFAGDDPFSAPLTAAMRGRSLGWDFDYELYGEQLTGLERICELRGESQVGIASAEFPGQWIVFPTPGHMYERARIAGCQNAVVSLTGDWGIFMSCESMAVLGCRTTELLDLFRRHIPHFDDEDVVDMLKTWRKETAGTAPAQNQWIPDLVRHVYESRAPELLRPSGWLEGSG